MADTITGGRECPACGAPNYSCGHTIVGGLGGVTIVPQLPNRDGVSMGEFEAMSEQGPVVFDAANPHGRPGEPGDPGVAADGGREPGSVGVNDATAGADGVNVATVGDADVDQPGGGVGSGAGASGSSDDDADAKPRRRSRRS